MSVNDIEPQAIKGFMPTIYWLIAILATGITGLAAKIWYSYEDRIKLLEDKVDDLVDEKTQYVTRVDFLNQVEKFEKKIEDLGKHAADNAARVEAKIDGLILFLMQKGNNN